MQGDIVKIIDQSGNVKASYTYDAWGKLLSVKDGAGNAVSSSNTFLAGKIDNFPVENNL